jgi:hypothetical protein
MDAMNTADHAEIAPKTESGWKYDALLGGSAVADIMRARDPRGYLL